MVGQNVLLCQTPIVVRLFKELAHLPQLVRITSTGPYHVQGMQLLARDLHYQHYTNICLLYTSDAADDMQCVDLGGRRII